MFVFIQYAITSFCRCFNTQKCTELNDLKDKENPLYLTRTKCYINFLELAKFIFNVELQCQNQYFVVWKLEAVEIVSQCP